MEDASPDGFGKSAWNYRYYVQAPFYLDGILESAESMAFDSFLFIAVEKSPPYNVAVYEAGLDVMQRGREAYLKDLDTYMNCIKSGQWPGYSLKAEPLRLPSYAYKKVY
jgi:exodeoxyribonuclease VIII